MAFPRISPLIAVVLLAITICALSGCGSGPGSDGLEKKSGVSLNLSWPSNYSFDARSSQLTSTSSPKMMSAPAYVTGCRVTISGADMSPVTLDVPLSSGQVSGSVTPGERSFSVVVDTDIGLSFSGSTSATLVPGYNGVISIGLSVNSPPELSGVSVSDSSPRKRETVTLTASVTDQDTADGQSFAWDGGGGSISGSGSSVSWSAGRSGSYTVTVTASDGHGGAARGSAVINVSNATPTINYVVVDNASAVVGDVLNLECSASDADGDRLSYTWSDGYGWTADGATSRYAVKSTAVSSLTCEVDDGDTNGRASGSARISAGSATIPAGVTAMPGNTQVTVSWNPVAGATSYNLYWSLTSPVTTTSAQIAGVTSPYQHTGLTNGTAYHYAVTAVGPSGESPLSAEVSATPPGGVLLAGLFSDVNLAACIAAAFPGATTTTQVTGYLDCGFKNISSLAGLQNLTGLTAMALYGNQITSLAPLTGLNAITWLDLGSNQIANVTPLTTLPNLTVLAIDGNQITDAKVAQLATITNLTWLHLRSNNITNIAPLANLANLANLWLGANNITSVTPLAGLTGLVQLELYGNNISNITPLSGLTSLTDLWLANNLIVNVAPLASLTSLAFLDLASNNITTGVGSLSTLISAQIYLSGNTGMSCSQLHTLICGAGNTVAGGVCSPTLAGLGTNVEISLNGIGNLDMPIPMPTAGANCTNP
ncbi:MAG: leucine-rich repeat domain-containing protein [Nitrospinae bacterium]|nr:leucine-rich repeat domain-containing protein [Nitrospinota bacterium]